MLVAPIPLEQTLMDRLTMAKCNRNRPMGARGKERDSNERCPRFVAYVSDSYCESDDSIETLITLIQHDARGAGEDVAIWDGIHKLAAIVFADGSVYRLDGQHNDIFLTKLRTVLLRTTSPSGERGVAQVQVPFVPGEDEGCIRAKAARVYHDSYGTACHIDEVVASHY
jgi:hypothetical protein